MQNWQRVKTAQTAQRACIHSHKEEEHKPAATGCRATPQRLEEFKYSLVPEANIPKGFREGIDADIGDIFPQTTFCVFCKKNAF